MQRIEIVRRVDKLTKAQKERLGEFRDKWIAIGLSTEPADRKRAEEGVKLAYAAGGLEPLEQFLAHVPAASGLAYIVAKQGGMNAAAAKAYVARLTREGRYLRDVY